MTEGLWMKPLGDLYGISINNFQNFNHLILMAKVGKFDPSKLIGKW
jgi:hypothetical protein